MATSEEFLNALNEEQLANILDNKDEEDDDVDSSQPSPPKLLRGSEANTNASTKNREKNSVETFPYFL